MSFTDRTDAVARWLERLIAGASPNDPLYVSNRTAWQKMRPWLWLGVPVLAAGVVLVVVIGKPDAALQSKAAPVPKPGEITAHVLPDLAKTYRSDSNPGCEVLEAGVAAHSLVGKVRNETGQEIHVADLTFDVTDSKGSQLGAVAVRVESIPPHAVVSFRQPLEQHNAQTALVREIHTR